MAPRLDMGVLTLHGIHLNFCVWRWMNVVPAQRSRIVRTFAFPLDLQMNLAIEQINFSGLHHPAVMDLTEDDVEGLADFIRFTMQTYLKAWTAGKVERAARYNCRAVGKLHENWRDPRPSLVALNERLSSYARSFTPARVQHPLLGRYEIEGEGWYCSATLKEEPDIFVMIPGTDREDPLCHSGRVRIGSQEIPIDIIEFYDVKPVETTLGENGDPIERFRLYAMIHPFSQSVEPIRSPPFGIDMSGATRAVQHMKWAWIQHHQARARTNTVIDVVIL
ncbi:hypothetical protein [Shinella kummerowiae]|uniref:hypothetical protein n=1 Tax=Shinella kummerowiae TaxID=417745 RepID=UPI0021B59AEB|nr:hypothetical protein [Shinella kummerowiae]